MRLLALKGEFSFDATLSHLLPTWLSDYNNNNNESDSDHLKDASNISHTPWGQSVTESWRPFSLLSAAFVPVESIAQCNLS